MKKLVCLLMMLCSFAGIYAQEREAATVKTVAKVNMRTRPSTQSKIVTAVPIRTKLSVIDRQGEWYYTSYNGNKGYVHKKYVAVVDYKEIKKKESKPHPMWEKTKEYIGKGILYIGNGVNTLMDRVFGDLRMTNKWWFLLYLGAILMLYIGLSGDTLVSIPCVWVGAIAQFIYLKYMAVPFYMCWPSIVGWGWTIVSVIPIVLLIGFSIYISGALVLLTFSSWQCFLLLLIPTFINVLSFFALIGIIFTDHLELIILILVSLFGESKTYLGKFTDSHGNVWDVYKN